LNRPEAPDLFSFSGSDLDLLLSQVLNCVVSLFNLLLDLLSSLLLDLSLLRLFYLKETLNFLLTGYLLLSLLNGHCLLSGLLLGL